MELNNKTWDFKKQHKERRICIIVTKKINNFPHGSDLNKVSNRLFFDENGSQKWIIQSAEGKLFLDLFNPFASPMTQNVNAVYGLTQYKIKFDCFDSKHPSTTPTLTPTVSPTSTPTQSMLRQIYLNPNTVGKLETQSLWSLFQSIAQKKTFQNFGKNGNLQRKV